MRASLCLSIARCALTALMLLPMLVNAAVDSVRLKDIGRFGGWRDNMLVGYGVATGLAGTGDSARSRTTRQSIANLLSQFDIVVPADQIQSRNVATVMITATLPPFARNGDKLDITVTSMGDARSLLGGILLMTPLKGPDGRTYALAQGALSVGGYKYDLNGNVVQKNHPTVGSIPGGASVEVAVGSDMLRDGRLEFVLADPDYTTANRIANAINAGLNGALAAAVDAATVSIVVPPDYRSSLVSFMTRLEGLNVQPDKRARVVVNERTGTVIAGADVTIARVTVSHGDLRVAVVTDYLVSQPLLLRGAGRGVRTEVVPQTRIDVSEQNVEAVQLGVGSTVADLVQALNRIKATPRDMISILQGIKAAGALRAELIIQ
jgi:flagellar P-ring protein precursor FlgI